MPADNPTSPTDRRRFLSIISSSGLAGVAGCVDFLDDSDREPDTPDESSPTEPLPTDGDTDDRVSIEGER